MKQLLILLICLQVTTAMAEDQLDLFGEHESDAKVMEEVFRWATNNGRLSLSPDARAATIPARHLYSGASGLIVASADHAKLVVKEGTDKEPWVELWFQKDFERSIGGSMASDDQIEMQDAESGKLVTFRRIKLVVAASELIDWIRFFNERFQNHIREVVREAEERKSYRKQFEIPFAETSIFVKGELAKTGATKTFDNWFQSHYLVLRSQRSEASMVLLTRPQDDRPDSRLVNKNDAVKLLEAKDYENPISNSPIDRILVIERFDGTARQIKALKVFSTVRYFAQNGEEVIKVVATTGEVYLLSQNTKFRHDEVIGVKIGETFAEALSRFNKTGPQWAAIDEKLPINETELKSGLLEKLRRSSRVVQKDCRAVHLR